MESHGYGCPGDDDGCHGCQYYQYLFSNTDQDLWGIGYDDRLGIISLYLGQYESDADPRPCRRPVWAKKNISGRDPYFYIRINPLRAIPKCNPANHFSGYSSRRRSHGHGLRRGHSHRSLSPKRARQGAWFSGGIGLRRFNKRSGPGGISPGMVALAFYLLCKNPLRSFCAGDGRTISKKRQKKNRKDKIRSVGDPFFISGADLPYVR